MEGYTSIKRKTEEQDVYVKLQAAALEDVQQLSGHIWTDYNAHDPGVTLMDALNYSLLEAHYKLGFGWKDYLSLPEKGFTPGQHTLFVPSEVFPVNPVTVTDYRKLLVSTVDEIADVRVIPDMETGLFNFLLEIWPETPGQRRDEILQEVRSLYHTHRNLCENLGEIRFLDCDWLELCAEVEVDEAADANRVMARLYLEAQSFLGSGVRFRRVDELLAEGKSPDEILEGPVQKRMVVDEASLHKDCQEYDLVYLYQKVRTLPGVSRISSFFFREGDTVYHNFLRRKHQSRVYAVTPFGENIQTVVIKRKGKEVAVDQEQVYRLLTSMRSRLYGAQNRTTDKDVLDAFPNGSYRNLYSRVPVLNDLPDVYKLKGGTGLRDYLKIFDSLADELLAELKSLPEWMSPDASFMSEKKERWMDMLDTMYDEDSNPAFLRKYEDDEQRRARRMAFLKDIPLWGLDRARAMNLADPELEDAPGLELYLKRLLDFDRFEMEMFVVEHNLLVPETPFSLTVVLGSAAEWLTDGEFRHSCEELISSRIPAHIQVRFCWQYTEKIGSFKSQYLLWRAHLAGLEISDSINESLKRYLADDNNWYCKV